MENEALFEDERRNLVVCVQCGHMHWFVGILAQQNCNFCTAPLDAGIKFMREMPPTDIGVVTQSDIQMLREMKVIW